MTLPIRLRSHLLIAALALCGVAGSALAQTKVVGYIPSYKGLRAVADRTDLSKLTHINIAFANPSANGSFLSGGNPTCMESATGGDISYVVQKAHAAGVKVLVSLAGGVIPGCSGNWQTLLQPGNRGNLVNNLAQFVNTFGLDGVDVDLEGALLTAIDKAGNYTPFIQNLRSALPGKLVTAATATYEGGMVPVSSLPHFDFVTLMSYDAVGPSWGSVGTEHSSYAMAQSHIATWQARGLPKEKLVLGVPFYGYGFNGYAADYGFNDIVAQFGASAAQKDLIGTLCASCGYITYNGIPTIKAKTRLALQQGSGVMIWELSQDGTGANSLLAAIRSEIGTPPPSGSSRLIEAESFTNQSGVQTEACVEGGSNVGWIDAGDWMVYGNVNFPSSGSYKVEYRVASPSGSKLSLDLNAGSIQLGQVTIPATGGWQNWTTVSHTVNVTAGTYPLGVYAPAGGWNLNWVRITKL
ncbi:carbohydrate-binding protein [Roseateles depolymerans]|uniref:chitinase n=1 Tax=Roseateles depolymerans TaxID=76731 RepID=A0A0U3M8E6_9BURK|nr:glycosyl hydrolase family 18 protein [Roseateles depolymerans]ALV04537.1 Chitinase [Roseateles depolymerans]REG14069.1 GH18 family chitinase [Roseateles depolymerans]